MNINSIISLFENYLLTESFKIAKQKFSQEAPEPQVEEYLNKFKQLAQKNLIDKDISKWIPKGWEAFKNEIDNNKDQASKTQIKRKKVAGKSITLEENDKWLIVIPLDKNASCFHGKNTDWCTTKPDESHFEEYFYKEDTTLIYFIRKTDGAKWAIAIADEYTFFDENDNVIDFDTFVEETGLNPNHYIGMAFQETNASKIDNTRNNYRKSLARLENTNWDNLTARDKQIEKDIHLTKSEAFALRYLNTIEPNQEIPESILILAIRYAPNSIRHIENPSEKLQLTAINNSATTIRHIKNPSEKVQLAAIKRQAGCINFIDNPSETMKFMAVDQQPRTIKYIKNPSEKLQLIAVNKNADFIEYIDNPTPQVQLVAIRNKPSSFKYIKNPTEKAKALAAKFNDLMRP